MFKKSSISGIFGKSPVRPLQKHILRVELCATKLRDYFAAVFVEDWVEAEKFQKTIADLEDEADLIKHDVRKNLPKSMFLPVPRHEMLDMLLVQDKIANQAKDIAGLVLGRKQKVPKEIHVELSALLETSLLAIIQARKAVGELEELIETGFGNNEVELVQNMIRELDVLEEASDVAQVVCRSALLKVEANYPPIDIIFIYKVIEWIGNLGDQADRVGSRLQMLLAR